MLRVNLNMLLAERNLTASRLSKETGISKTTLTSLVNNTGKGIQYDTIDTICNFLGVTPNEFFDYVPIDYVFDYENVELVLEGSEKLVTGGIFFFLDNINHSFDFYVDIKTGRKNNTFVFKGVLEPLDDDQTASNPFEKELRFNLEFKNNKDSIEFDDLFYKRISKGHQTLFNENTKDFITNNFKELFDKEFEEKGGEIHSLDFDNPIIYLPWDLPF